MESLAIILLLVVLAVAIVLVAARLRGTTSIGGAVVMKDPAGNRLSIDKLLEEQVAATGSKPVVSISMVTRRVGSESAESTEAITIDGRTYHSVEDIPPEVRDRVRGLLAQARAEGGTLQPGATDARVRIEHDLAELGLDLRERPAPPDAPPGEG
jgi:hypothetical protein